MVNPIRAQTLPDRITKFNQELTPKSRIIGDYVQANPRKVVFMTVAELAKACEVSEATVVRFVGQLGYEGYSDFQQSLREFVDTEMTLLDRVDLKDMLEIGIPFIAQLSHEPHHRGLADLTGLGQFGNRHEHHLARVCLDVIADNAAFGCQFPVKLRNAIRQCLRLNGIDHDLRPPAMMKNISFGSIRFILYPMKSGDILIEMDISSLIFKWL